MVSSASPQQSGSVKRARGLEGSGGATGNGPDLHFTVALFFPPLQHCNILVPSPRSPYFLDGRRIVCDSLPINSSKRPSNPHALDPPDVRCCLAFGRVWLGRSWCHGFSGTGADSFRGRHGADVSPAEGMTTRHSSVPTAVLSWLTASSASNIKHGLTSLHPSCSIGGSGPAWLCSSSSCAYC